MAAMHDVEKTKRGVDLVAYLSLCVQAGLVLGSYLYKVRLSKVQISACHNLYPGRAR
jgi:hypothetical protein